MCLYEPYYVSYKDCVWLRNFFFRHLTQSASFLEIVEFLTIMLNYSKKNSRKTVLDINEIIFF